MSTVSTFFPAPGTWAAAAPADVGIDPERLASAVALARSAETPWPRRLETGLGADPTFDEPEPWNEVLGPTLDRGGPNGLVVRHGRIAARWGDTSRREMTFSVAKSYLALLAGIALREGLIRTLDDRVADYALDDGYASAQNRDITWRHLLEQSSEWQGTLWSKPDQVDHHREVGPGADNSRKGELRALRRPGTHYEYNDVRVNRLSLDLLYVFREPLPEVLGREVMSVVGASDTWEWHPYRNARVVIDGRTLASVPGGSHWGGGIFIGSEDHARVALMVLEDGCWDGRRVLPEGYVDALAAPSPCNPSYGLLWWLNTGRRFVPSAPESSFFALGAGSHLIWIDRSLDLVAVLRWIDRARVDEVVAAITRSL